MSARILELPIERLDFYESDVLGNGRYSIRSTPDGAVEAGKPDRIGLALSFGGTHVSFSFTPSQLVHLANTLLTDEERSYINAPLADCLEIDAESGYQCERHRGHVGSHRAALETVAWSDIGLAGVEA